MGGAGSPGSLVERLGHPEGTRAVILNADDFGMCHSANSAIIDLMSRGLIDSASLMVPCAWAPEAAAYAASSPAADIGVHLVLTSEWSRQRWRPLTGFRSTLTDADGFFPRDVPDVERRADADEVMAELEAQIDSALRWGVDVTHLDSHMGAVFGVETGRAFLPAVLESAARRGLPFRLPRSTEGTGIPAEAEPLFAAFVEAADRLGVIIPDRHLSHPFELLGEGAADEESYVDVLDGLLSVVRSVPAGVTEIFLHPMVDSDELRATADIAHRKRDYEYRVLADPAFAETLAEEGIVRTSWRALRDVQRAASAIDDQTSA